VRIEKKEFIEICRNLYLKEFVAGTDGNVSVRIGKNKILCTPTSLSKGKIKDTDLVLINLDGQVISGKRKPSTEIKMHLAIYKYRDDVNAVIHAHPIFATAYASSKLALEIPVLPEVVLNLGIVPVCKYATPSTEEVVNSILSYLQITNVLLLQNHGAVTYGNSLEEAYFYMEKLEHNAKIFFISSQLKGVNSLSKEQLEKLYSINEKNYKIDQSKKIKFL